MFFCFFFSVFCAFSANDADPVVRLRVRAQTISAGHFHIQSYENSGNRTSENSNGSYCWRKPIDDAKSAYLSLAEEKKTKFQVTKFSVKKIAAFLFCPRLKIAAFSRFQNRSVFGTLSLRASALKFKNFSLNIWLFLGVCARTTQFLTIKFALSNCRSFKGQHD